jgi:hypothetical protein
MKKKITNRPSRRIDLSTRRSTCIEDVVEPWPLNYKNRRPFSNTHSEVAQFWYYKKNCGFGPEDFSFGSGVKAWWFCPKGKDHIFQAAISDRVKRFAQGNGCPFCRGFKPSVTNSVAACYPKLAKEWAPGLNELTPNQVTWGSKKRIWWQCKLGHIWDATPQTRTRGCGCPDCFLGGAEGATDLRNYPKVLRQFDRQANVGIDPYKLSVARKAWWQCDKSPDHVWFSAFHRPDYTAKSQRCPFCRGKRASKINNLTMDERLLREFHPKKNGALKPEDVSLGTHRRVWWRCKKGPDHEWQVSVNDRRHYNSGCPFCANKRVSVTNSFANVAAEAVVEWHPTKNKPATPETIVATSMTKYWFRCKNGHVYQQRPFHKTNFNSGCKTCYFKRGSTGPRKSLNR